MTTPRRANSGVHCRFRRHENCRRAELAMSRRRRGCVRVVASSSSPPALSAPLRASSRDCLCLGCRIAAWRAEGRDDGARWSPAKITRPCTKLSMAAATGSVYDRTQSSSKSRCPIIFSMRGMTFSGFLFLVRLGIPAELQDRCGRCSFGACAASADCPAMERRFEPEPAFGGRIRLHPPHRR